MADIQVTIPNTTFAVTTPASGISVTTPTDYDITVTPITSEISVVNTPTTISVLTSGTLTINSDQGVDSVNGLVGTVVIDTDLIGEGSTNLYYTSARVEAHEFSEVKIDNLVRINTATETTASTAEFTLDSFSATAYASAHYKIQIKSGTDYQFLDIAVVQNSTTATFVIYADIRTNGNLSAFAADINAGSVRLRATPTNAATTYRAVRTAIIA